MSSEIRMCVASGYQFLTKDGEHFYCSNKADPEAELLASGSEEEVLQTLNSNPFSYCQYDSIDDAEDSLADLEIDLVDGVYYAYKVLDVDTLTGPFNTESEAVQHCLDSCH